MTNQFSAQVNGIFAQLFSHQIVAFGSAVSFIEKQIKTKSHGIKSRGELTGGW
jgi:hypothetical protein